MGDSMIQKEKRGGKSAAFFFLCLILNKIILIYNFFQAIHLICDKISLFGLDTRCVRVYTGAIVTLL